MNQIRLFLDDKQISFLTEGEFAVTDKLFSPISQEVTGGTYSTNFDVKLIPELNAFLGFPIDNFSSITRTRKIDAEILNDNDTIMGGFVQVLSINPDENKITMAFASGNSQWNSSLSGKQIRELNWIDLQHTWIPETVVENLNNSSGFVYPYVDYGRYYYNGELSFPTSTDIRDWLPALYTKEVIVRIFNEIGFAVTGSFLDRSEWKREVIPFSLIYPTRGFSTAESQAQYEDFSWDVSSFFLATGNVQYDTTFDQIIFTNNETIFDADKIFEGDAGSHDLNITFNIAHQWEATRASSFAGGAVRRLTVVAQVFDGTTVIDFDNLYEYVDNFGGESSPQLGSDTAFIQAAITLTTTSLQWIRLHVIDEFSGLGTSSTITDQIEITNIIVTAVGQLVETDPELLPGETFDFKFNLPRINLSDFLSDFVKRYGIMITASRSQKIVSLDAISDVLQGKTGEQQDLSKYAVGFSQIDFVEFINKYGKQSNYTYQQDKNDTQVVFYNRDFDPELGNGFFNIDNNFIASYVDIYKSFFGSSRQISYSDASGVALHIQRYDQDGEYQEPVPRIAMITDDGTANSGILGTTTLGDVTLNSQLRGLFFFDEYLSPSRYPDLSFNSLTGIFSYSQKDWYELIQRSPRIFDLTLIMPISRFSELKLNQLAYVNNEKVNGKFLIIEIQDYRGNYIPFTIRLLEII
jgi:hypothetical protein